MNKDKFEHINFSKEVFQFDYKFVERNKILGLWFERDLSFKTHAANISASIVKFWKETSIYILIIQGLIPFYAVPIFDSYVICTRARTCIWHRSLSKFQGHIKQDVTF